MLAPGNPNNWGRLTASGPAWRGFDARRRFLRTFPRGRFSLFVLVGLASATALVAQDARFQGAALEEFLAKARVTDMHAIGRGVTLPRRVTLLHDGQTRDAAWKTINESRQGVTRLPGQRPEIDFEDTWRTECAAYRLDRLLNLGMVPATVERAIGGERGSLTLWIAPAISEAERLAKTLTAPDPEAWNRQMYKVRYFDNLISNMDRNLHNILVTPEWEIRLIDHSRAFRRAEDLRDSKGLTRFSRSLVEAAARLDESMLKAHLGRYISSWQIKSLLARRDRLAALAREQASERGEPAVFYP